MKPNLTNVPNEDKNLTYYPAWLEKLKQATDYHGGITDLSIYVAKKCGKTMENMRPTISKIIKGRHQASPEYLLIIQEWMDTTKSRTGKK